MKKIILCILSLFLFTSNTNALNCDKVFLNPLVYRMCKSEETLIEQDTEKLKDKKDKLTKAIFDTAEKQGKSKELKAALASSNKSPSEEYLINSFIFQNKTLLDDIEYTEWQLTASKEELDQIMDNYLEKNTFPKKIKK